MKKFCTNVYISKKNIQSNNNIYVSLKSIFTICRYCPICSFVRPLQQTKISLWKKY